MNTMARQFARGTACISAQISRTIPAPVSQVFPFVANANNDPLWIDAISHSRRLDTGPLTVGSRFEQTAVGFGIHANVVWEITEYVENCYLITRSVAGDYDFTGGYEFDVCRKGTTVTKFAYLRRSGLLFAAPKFLANAMMRQAFQAWLAMLAARQWHLTATKSGT